MMRAFELQAHENLVVRFWNANQTQRLLDSPPGHVTDRELLLAYDVKNMTTHPRAGELTRPSLSRVIHHDECWYTVVADRDRLIHVALSRNRNPQFFTSNPSRLFLCERFLAGSCTTQDFPINCRRR